MVAETRKRIIITTTPDVMALSFEERQQRRQATGVLGGEVRHLENFRRVLLGCTMRPWHAPKHP
jgi:hypothetical protein